MIQVVFTGWKIGLRKVSLDVLLVRKARMSLSQAHAQVNAFVGGEQFIVEMQTLPEAEELVKEAEEMGAIREIRPQG